MSSSTSAYVGMGSNLYFHVTRPGFVCLYHSAIPTSAVLMLPLADVIQ
jgi:hypothetical protein